MVGGFRHDYNQNTQKYGYFSFIADYLNLGNFEYCNGMLRILEVARVQNRIIILEHLVIQFRPKRMSLIS